jgi:hypothetical protein
MDISSNFERCEKKKKPLLCVVGMSQDSIYDAMQAFYSSPMSSIVFFLSLQSKNKTLVQDEMDVKMPFPQAIADYHRRLQVLVGSKCQQA